MHAVSLRDLEPLAQQMLSERTWNYVAGGAADEVTLGWNDAAWRDLRLAPRVLVDVSSVDTVSRAARATPGTSHPGRPHGRAPAIPPGG